MNNEKSTAMNETSLLTYSDVLEKINSTENHLLLGNGFNYGLGVNTGYKAIFDEMISTRHELYKDAKQMVEGCEYDLEKFIGKLVDSINSENEFLKKFVANKVKLDFMQATHKIVKSSIKNIYAEKNEGIFILLKNFSNYFTLNYDSFLYILLLNYKTASKDEGNINEGAIALTPSLKFIEEDMNTQQNDIFTEIKEIRERYKLKIESAGSNDTTTIQFSKLTKTHFITEVKSYSKLNKKNWKSDEINKVVNLILEEEKKNNILETVDDGSRQLTIYDIQENHFENPNTQNIFFLHGAFHIVEENGVNKKITQKSNKALYEKLEETLNSDERNIVAIFQSIGKKEVIEQNKYLKYGYDKLKTLFGSLVIIGSSLASNDSHIFKQIKDSEINKVYISTMSNEKDSNYETAKKLFPSKKIYMFDAETISYELPENDDIDM